MRSLSDSYGPYTTVGTYELPIGGCAFNSFVLEIQGTANADLEYWVGGGTWTAYSGFSGRTATTSGTSLHAMARTRVKINSISGGTVYLHHAGLRG